MSKMSTLKKESVRVRDELEKFVLEIPACDYTEENGILVKKVTQADVYKAVKHLSSNARVQGQFLLHLDDRLTEQNGYHEKIIELEEKVDDICARRDETCPVLPLVKGIEEDFEGHISEQTRANIVSETTEQLKQKWMNEGQKASEEERAKEDLRFRKKTGWIGTTVAVITLCILLLRWLVFT